MIPALITELEGRLGPLQVTRTKPFSVQLRSQRDRSLIKIYREIDPAGRQARELYALRKVPDFGITVPDVLNHGLHGSITWTELAVAPGTPLPLKHDDDVPAFLAAAQALLAPLHAREITREAGYGWNDPRSSATSVFLASQLSQHTRSLSFWPQLRDHLRSLDVLPVVRLHGDVKPEHILIGAGPHVLVDWEACARGPAVLDETDATFRVLRDLAYANQLTSGATALLPRTEQHAIALTWRIVLWLDRRHDAPSPRGIALAERAARLPDVPDPISMAADILRDAQREGIQY